MPDRLRCSCRSAPRPRRHNATRVLRAERSNTDERHAEIAEYEDLKAKVEAVLDATAEFLADRAAEDALERNAKWFAATMRTIWDKRHLQIADAGFFLSAAGVCHSLIGVDANLAATICGALVGPKVVVDALKAVYGEDK